MAFNRLAPLSAGVWPAPRPEGGLCTLGHDKEAARLRPAEGEGPPRARHLGATGRALGSGPDLAVHRLGQARYTC